MTKFGFKKLKQKVKVTIAIVSTSTARLTQADMVKKQTTKRLSKKGTGQLHG